MSQFNKLSVIILTRNEEAFIERCIRSVVWADEVLVCDSVSEDSTQSIARSLGATVIEQPWLGWSQQRNKATSAARNDWVMFLEADEIVTRELGAAIRSLLATPMNPSDGYYLNRRGDFLGILMPNIQRGKKRRRFVRLFNRTSSEYDPRMLVHEEVLVPGKRLPLSGTLIHWRGYTLDEYVPVFNRYATLEAKVLWDKGERAGAYLILVRPVLRFAWLYVWKQNWRNGTRGLIHSLLKAYAEFIRFAKLWEMQHAPRVIDPPSFLYSASVSDESTQDIVSRDIASPTLT